MTRTFRFALAGVLWLGARVAGAQGDSGPTLPAIIDGEFPSLAALYQHFHSHPELSYQERATAVRLAEELRAAGYEVTPNVGGLGLVAVLKNGPGRTLMIRSDLDALPVKEDTGLPFASRAVARDDSGNEVPVAHACGHDLHMTNLVGTARALAQLRAQWKGTLILIGQPAEERGGGARKMIADGLFTRFPRPDAVLALHVDSSLQAGKVGYTSGYAMANVDSVDITLRGVGGHGAYPEATKDPIVLAAQVVLALQTIVSREVRAADSAVVTVGSIHGGTKHNIIPDEARLQLTVRSYTDEVRAQLLASIRRIPKGLAEAAGIPPELAPIVAVDEGEYTPACYNDPELVKVVTASIRRVLGEGNVVEREPMMGGEDFSRYGREAPRIPIFMFRLGSISAQRMAGAGDGTGLPSLHSGRYYPDLEPTLRAGIAAMTAAALDQLAN